MPPTEPGVAGGVRNLAAARAAHAAGRPSLVWAAQVADTETPVAAALKLIAPGRGDFLLESVEGGATRGRYSLLGLAPDLLFRAQGQAAAINRVWASDRDAFEPCPEPTLPALRALAAACQIPDLPEGLPRALACLVGYFGYETLGLVEDVARPAVDPLGLPDLLFVRPSVLLVFDRLADTLFVVAPVWPEGDVGAAAARVEATVRELNEPLPPVRFERGRETLGGRDVSRLPSDARQPVLSACLGRQSKGSKRTDSRVDVSANVPPDRYAAMVRQAQDYIAAGDIFQVVLAQRFSAPFALPPFELYRSLRRINPSPFLYHLDLPGFALVGSSPEILVRVRDGEVTIRPIAGTRPRGATAAADEANRAELLADPKERAEHLMLLDLGRNDVGRVAAAGSVRVTESFTVERYSHVMHIVSNVVGALDPRHDALDAMFAGFPAGTVSGAPKLRACQIVAELEGEARGAYAGAVGYFAPDGSFDSCIVLRTGLVQDGTLHVTAGAGIVADSDPAAEQRECEAKAGALFAAALDAVARAGS